jgi:hypothetical protein
MKVICAPLAKLQQEQHAISSLLLHMNEVFANCSKEDKTYPLTTEEIAEAQWADGP